jgi:Domain of unknown function (DUF5671)
VIAPIREASEESDLIEQIGDGILMLIAFASLRETLWHACRIVFRLIDLTLAPEPLKIAEQLNRASDPRWSVSVLLVALPLFLITFWMFSARLENNPLLRHGKLFIVVLVLFVLDATVTAVTTIPVLLYGLISDAAILSTILKTTTIAIVYGVLLAYLVGELQKAASP